MVKKEGESKHSLKGLKNEIKYIKKQISKDNDLYKKVIKLEAQYDEIKVIEIQGLKLQCIEKALEKAVALKLKVNLFKD